MRRGSSSSFQKAIAMRRTVCRRARLSRLHALKLESLEQRWVPALTVPALSSLPGASATIYLDFDGHYEGTWGSYSNITSPAYDTDGNASAFSDTELANIEKIWRYVSEDFAPFNINVTTVAPSSFANGVALRVVIGGNSSWAGGTYGGIAYVNSFTNSVVNTVYVFPAHLSNGNPKYVADAASHESGHAFGLRHQSAYSGTTISKQYQSGPGDGTAPLMGNSYSAGRSMWWYGLNSVSSTTYQNDMAIIASSTNGFGFRADDYANTRSSATQLTVSTSGAISRSGIIGQMDDADWFSFTTGAGSISLTADVPNPYNNLDARIDLYDGSGTLLATGNPTTSFDATVTATVAAGTYYVSITSTGASSAATSTNYGFNVGQYTLTGSVVYVDSQSTTTPSAPTSLAASAVSTSSIDLSWVDNASNETGYRIERQSGGNWSEVATVGANASTWRDSGLTAGATYTYRVRAYNTAGDSSNSNQASATTQSESVTSKPAAASNLRASTQASPLGVVLNWNDNASNESGFYVQRSANRGRWTQIASLGANVTSYTDTKVSLGSTYDYRVVAFNSVGAAKASNSVKITVVAGAPSGGDVARAGGSLSGNEQSPLAGGKGGAAGRGAASWLISGSRFGAGGQHQHHSHEDDEDHVEANTNIVPSVFAGHDAFFAKFGA